MTVKNMCKKWCATVTILGNDYAPFCLAACSSLKMLPSSETLIPQLLAGNDLSTNLQQDLDSQDDLMHTL